MPTNNLGKIEHKFQIYVNKMKNKKYHTVPISNRKIVERGKIYGCSGLFLVCPHLFTPIINQLNKQKRQRVY